VTKRLSIDNQFHGDEPTLSVNSTDGEVIRAWNWFNYYHDSDDAKGFVLSYLKSVKKKELAKRLAKVDAHKLRTIGWNCRILTNGGSLPVGLEKSMWFKLEALTPKEQEEEVVVETRQVISIQDRINARAGNLIALLEDQVDIFINNGKNDFDIVEWMQKQAVKPQIAKKIVEYYNPLYSELFDAYKGTDKELRDAYSHLKKSQIKKYMEFVKAIISAADTQAVIVQTQIKKSRKPRKRKEKPAGVLVSKLKFKTNDEAFKIASIKATEIIGAQQLWVFNTKTRALTVLNAMSHAGLSVKGSTVLGFDEKTSITKKLRKPDQILPQVVDGGKVTLRNLMKTIKTRDVAAKGRINNEVVLLRAIK